MVLISVLSLKAGIDGALNTFIYSTCELLDHHLQAWCVNGCRQKKVSFSNWLATLWSAQVLTPEQSLLHFSMHQYLAVLTI